MIQYLKIGTYNAPQPRSFKCEYNDIDGDKTARNENGYLKDRDRLRADMLKISASFRLKIDELSGLASAISPKIFEVTAFDLTTAKYVKKKMYASSKASELVYPDKDKPDESWVDYSFTLIEC